MPFGRISRNGILTALQVLPNYPPEGSSQFTPNTASVSNSLSIVIFKALLYSDVM